MLSAVGIIAEYNPFHNGHCYQIQVAKKRAQADVVVAVMSGNWVQRGAPAIVDKWTRTQMAIEAGVDLVVELPVFGAVQAADIFADRAFQIVDQLGCRALAFGCEHDDYDFAKLGQVKLSNQSVTFNNYHQSYPALVQAQIEQELGVRIDQPNDTLALNYARARYRLGSQIELVAIERQGSSHHDDQLGSAIASASAIRKATLNGELKTTRAYLPATSYELLQSVQHLDWPMFWPLLRYQLLTTPLSELRLRYQMTEGLEYRLKRAAIANDQFDAFIDAVKTKRYTYARIQRLLVVVLLQVNDDAMLRQPDYLRVLGFSPMGQKYLKQVKANTDWSIISKANQSVLQSKLQTEFQAGMLVQMQTGGYQDLYRHPFIKK
ncbi:nucleotidyltransferase [Lactobacillaceae bacterium Scapto_B20]